MSAVSTRDALRAWRRRTVLATVALIVTLGLLSYHAARDAARSTTAPTCKPIALSVVVGDTAEGDVAYVLDSCGKTHRQPADGAR